MRSFQSKSILLLPIRHSIHRLSFGYEGAAAYAVLEGVDHLSSNHRSDFGGNGTPDCCSAGAGASESKGCKT